MSKKKPFMGDKGYLRRAHDWFTSKHGVRFPWQAVKKDPELIHEWCEVMQRFKELEEEGQ